VGNWYQLLEIVVFGSIEAETKDCCRWTDSRKFALILLRERPLPRIWRDINLFLTPAPLIPLSRWFAVHTLSSVTGVIAQEIIYVSDFTPWR